MATKIVTKNSSTASAVPTASDLVQGELAVNVADKRLFTEDNGGAIVELGTNPSTIDIDAGSIDGTAIGASSASTGAFTTLTASGAFTSVGIDDNADATAITIDSSENVGIGTSSPDANLVVYETATSGTDHFAQRWRTQSGGVLSIACSDLSLANPTWQIRSGSSEPIAFNQASNERMRIDSSGRVGIGTSSPSEKLTIAGDVQIGESAGGEKLKFVGASSKYNFLVGKQVNVDNALEITPSTAAGGTTFSTPAVVVNSSGNVGIGTTSPNSKLDTGGDYYSGTATTVAQLTNKISTYSTVSQGSLYGFGQDSYGLHMTAGQAGQSLMFHTGGSAERVRIDGSGNLLVGKTSAVGQSTAGIEARGDGVLIATKAGTVQYLNRTGSDGTILNFAKDGTTVGSISTNANSLPSDRNFKRNIQDLTLGLDFVESLNPVTYNFKIDDEGQAVMTGLIAQEVEEALTAAGVEKNSMTLLQHSPTEDVNESDYQMDYLKFVPILINSIKEQQTLIESLTARIAALEE